MITFLDTPQPRTPNDPSAGLRTHVLRVVNTDQILYSVATSKHTEIQLIKCDNNSHCQYDTCVRNGNSTGENNNLSNTNNNYNSSNHNNTTNGTDNSYQDGYNNNSQNDNNSNSTTVIAFNRYMDIIDADLSSDLEMLVYTERQLIGNSFKYESVLCHIHSFSKLKVFNNADPIASYFIPENANYLADQKTKKTYQIIHIIGDKVLHFRVSFRNQKVDVRIMRDGINLTGCKKWFFSQKEMIFYAMQNTGNIKVYSILEGKGLKIEKFQYTNDDKSILPKELALLPSTLVNLPYYRFSSGISFCTKTPNDDYGIIEQLYRGDDSSLAFIVATLKGKFRKLVAVPGIQPDMPISFICHQKVVFVFVPNCFITMVDFNSEMPHITMMPKSFCLSNSSRLTSSVNSSNFLTDLESGKLYRCRFSLMNFPSSLHYTNRAVLSMFAKIATVLPNHISISGAIENLPPDISCVQYFFKSLFSYANQFTHGNINLSNFSRRKSEISFNNVNYNYNYNLAVYSNINGTNNNNKSGISSISSSSSINCLNSVSNNVNYKNNINNICSSISNIDSNIDTRANNAAIANGNQLFSEDSEEDRSTNSSAVFSKFNRSNNINSKSRMFKRKQEARGDAAKELIRERKLDIIARVESGIDVWAKEKEPSTAQQLAIEVAAVFEAKAANMPALPVNADAMNDRAARICPQTISTLLMRNGVVEKTPRNEKEKDELVFWKCRFDIGLSGKFTSSSASSSTSLSASSSFSNSVKINFVGNNNNANRSGSSSGSSSGSGVSTMAKEMKVAYLGGGNAARRIIEGRIGHSIKNRRENGNQFQNNKTCLKCG